MAADQISLDERPARSMRAAYVRVLLSYAASLALLALLQIRYGSP